MPNVKTLKLDGAEIAVKFPYSYPYYMIANMGDNEIYASGNSNIVPYGDGVYTVLPGIETRISPERSGDTVYLLGNGTVQVRAEEIAMQTSFRLARKGGGDSGIMYTDCEYSDLLITDVFVGTLFEEENL